MIGLILAFFSPRFGLSVLLLMLPLSPESLALRAAIGLIDPLGFAILGGCLRLPLSLRGTTTRAFSGDHAILGSRSLHIPVIYLVSYNSAHLLFPPVEWNEVVGEYEFGRQMRGIYYRNGRYGSALKIRSFVPGSKI